MSSAAQRLTVVVMRALTGVLLTVLLFTDSATLLLCMWRNTHPDGNRSRSPNTLLTQELFTSWLISGYE